MKSVMLQRAFDSLSCLTVLSAEQRQNHIAVKRSVIRQVEESHVLDVNVLRSYPIVYVASHIDVRMPLCLGGRKIDLVDPCFRELESVLNVSRSIEEITQRQVRSKLGIYPTIEFDFDFGNGTEVVVVRCLDRWYSNTIDSVDHTTGLEDLKLEKMTRQRRHAPRMFGVSESSMDYEPDGPIGFLLGFNTYGVFFDRNPGVVSSIVSGGYILNNRRYECLRISDDRSEEIDALLEENPDLYYKLVRKEYDNAGEFEIFPVLCRSDWQMVFTFLRKR